jgi:hypothetical protein
MIRPVMVAIRSPLCLPTAIILHFESCTFRPRRVFINVCHMILRTEMVSL